MIRLEKHERSQIEPLFRGIEDSMVLSYLQGYMGDGYVNHLQNPSAALIISGEYSFFGGNPNSEDALELIKQLFSVNPSECSVCIFPEEEPLWEQVLLSVKENHPTLVPRFGIVQKDYCFDEKILEKYMDSVPKGYDLIPFSKEIYHKAMMSDWSKEFCETFQSAEEYLNRGFGFAVLKRGDLVSGASTMTVYDGGIEVQVATVEGERGKGLAIACAAALLMECKKRNLRPCWDAANLASKKMALSLGYEYRGEYPTIHIQRASNG